MNREPITFKTYQVKPKTGELHKKAPVIMGDIDHLKNELRLKADRLRAAANDPEAVRRISKEIMEFIK